MSESGLLQQDVLGEAPAQPVGMEAVGVQPVGVEAANRRALDLISGAQRLWFEEMAFVANELLDRTQTETHLFAEFISKLASSHSVRDWGTMCRECSQHQLDFIRRDCDRLVRHGERMVTAASGLLNDPPRA